MDFVFEFQPEICVEIGTFGGSTTYPLASALEFLGQGKLYAIDAWENHAAIEGLEENDPNLEWWKNLDLVGIRQRFFQFLILKKLRAWCHPIALLSQEAVSSFADESIDLLYIDGNFSEEGSLRDVLFYFPKVKKGGFIWLNDANVATKKKSVIFLMDNSQWLKKWSLKNSCIVFQK